MNYIKKIVYLVESHFSQRDYKRFGIEVMIKNGFEVEIWDATPIIHPDNYKKITISDPCYFKNIKFFLAKDHLTHSILTLKNTFIICFVFYNDISYFIYEAMTKNNILYSVFLSNLVPITYQANKKRFLSELKNKLIYAYSLLIKRELLSYLWKKLQKQDNKTCSFLVKTACFVLAGGEIFWEQYKGYNYPIDEHSKILWLHQLDYDLYLEAKNKQDKKGHYAVFLDEYYPFHPDYLYLNISPPTTAEEYYPLLLKFFEYLEKKIKIKVVIAAHPRSQYENHPDYFKGREVIKGNTVQLVRDCQFVITHSCNANNYSVLFKKPIIFITTSKIMKSIHQNYIDGMAKCFNKNVINLNEKYDIDFNSELFIDEKAYHNFKSQYIKKKDSIDLPFWQIVSDEIKNLGLS